MLKAVPPPTKQGSDETKLLSKQGYDAMVEVITHLFAHTDLRERTARFVAEQVALKAEKEEKRGIQVFCYAGCQLQQLDDIWVCAFITKKTGLSTEILGKVIVKDRSNIYLNACASSANLYRA